MRSVERDGDDGPVPVGGDVTVRGCDGRVARGDDGAWEESAADQMRDIVDAVG